MSDHQDLTESLRLLARYGALQAGSEFVLKAADEIERLRQLVILYRGPHEEIQREERDRYRKALEQIAKEPCEFWYNDQGECVAENRTPLCNVCVAREALKEQQ